MFKLLTSKRLLFRKVELSDAEIMWNEMFHDYEYYKMYHRLAFDSKEEYIQYISALIRGYKNPSYYRWSVLPSQRKQGYAKESISTVSNFAFTDLGFKSVCCGVYKGNDIVAKTLLNIGFEHDESRSSKVQNVYVKKGGILL